MVSALQYFPVADRGGTKTSLCQMFKAVFPGRKILSEGGGVLFFCVFFFILDQILVLSDCSVGLKTSIAVVILFAVTSLCYHLST